MSLDVFNTGMFVSTSQPSSGTAASYNFGVPTNPIMTTLGTSFTNGDVLFSVIYPDDSEETVINEVIGLPNATLQAEYENLSVTKGYNLHCFNAEDSVGISLATIDAATGSPNINTHYYFVLIHSDDHLKHHFARITEIKSSDTLGDSFDFEPKLGNEIAQGTKFKLYKGPAISSKGVAFSAGIKQDLKASLHVARPHFWFVDSLDKKDELNHNTKYFARVEAEGDGSFVRLNSSTDKVTFVTVTDYGQKVVDYSKYSLNATISDNLRTQDAVGTYSLNESQIGSGTTATPALASQNDANYDTFAPNARRDTDDAINDGSGNATYNFKGPVRYLHYDYSPTKNNYINNVIDLEVEESLGKKSSYAEIKVSDSYRILSQKINNYDSLRIRHSIHRGDFNDWISFGATITSVTSNVSNKPLYAITTPVDLTTYLNDGDEVLINSRVMIVFDVTASTLRFYQESRLETDSAFTTTTSIASIAADTEIYRRAWNKTDGTLLTGMRMIDNRQDNLHVSLMGEKFSQLEASVTSYISQTGLLTLSFPNQGYDNTLSLDNMTGSYEITNEKLNGRITKLSKQKDASGLTVMEIGGADKLRELLEPIIEKNTLFSKDIVYSTDSPYNRVLALGVNATCLFTNNALTLSGVIDSSKGGNLIAGDKIFAISSSGGFIYLGEIASVISNTQYLFTSTSNGQVTAKAAYKASTKFTVFNKALSSNSSVSSSTSLYGAANKGITFESGTTLVNGVETLDLVSSSIDTTNSKARGYYLSEAKNIKSDNLFQARLDDDATNLIGFEKSYATFDTVNTLIDFNILSIKAISGNQVIEIAPHMPLTLGRVDINYGNTQDTTYTSLGTSTAAITATTQRYIITQTTTVLSGVTSGNPARNYHGKPLYINSIFVGFITLAVLQNDNTNIYIYVDRILPVTSSGSTLSSLNGDSTYDETGKLQHELSLLNGGHLHGGKIIGLLSHSKNGTHGTYLFDFPLYYNSGTYAATNSARYGMPYYRITNLEKGNVTKNKIIYTNPLDVNYSYYEEKLSKIPYYASAYKFNPAFKLEDNQITGVGKKDTIGKHIPIESRNGSIPPLGSNFFDSIKNGVWDTYFMPFYIDPTTDLNSTATDHRKTPYAAKDTLWQPDPKVSRMFLFINSDINPYSSIRKDSLLNETNRDISKYNLFALTDGLIEENSHRKDVDKINTKTINYKDSNYSSSNILSSDRTLSDLNRFGMMRLTELCFDWAFNQFDPENPPDKEKTLPKLNYYHHEVTSTSRTIAAASNTTLTMSGACTVVAGDEIIDAEGRYIGIVASGSTGSTITLVSNHYRTNGAALNTTSVIFRIEGTTESKITGHGTKDSFVELYEDIHMLKTAVVNQVETNGTSNQRNEDGYSKANESFKIQYGSELGAASGAASRVHNLFAPVNLGGIIGTTGLSDFNAHPSLFLQMIDTLTGTDTSNSPNGATDLETYNQWFLPIFLDRFSIEDGSSLAESGMVGAHVKNASKAIDSSGSADEQYSLLGFALNTKFANKENMGSDGNITYDKTADGVFLGFKPRLYLTTGDKLSRSSTPYSTGVASSAGNGFAVAYGLTPTGQHTWLKHVNLTGTYLISNGGKYINTDGVVVGTSETDNDVGLDGVSPNNIVYVHSHEIDHSNGTRTHILILDNVITSSYFRIMQPNHTCTYDFSPKEIALNTLSSKYTKMPYENSMYDGINNYALQNAKGDRTLQGDNEGILSMYVLINTDITGGGAFTSDKVIVPSTSLSNMLLGKNGKYCISDGDTTFSSNLIYNKAGSNSSISTYLASLLGHSISLDTMKETLGVVSVSEITSITVSGESPINVNSKRAMIGSVVNICNETEDIIEELLEEQGVSFDITREDYPLFTSPNFQGITLFEAINHLLIKKDKTLVQTTDTFTIKNKKDSGFYNDLLISDRGDIKIYEYELLDSTFEEFNEVIVHGKSHKQKRQNPKSVKLIGKKSEKFFERELVTQEEVDNRASDLLRIHNGKNKKLKITIGHKNISQIKVGDIVNVEIKQENIPRNQYLILEINHTMTGLMEVQLGKYINKMEDRFSELITAVKSIEEENNLEENKNDIPPLQFIEDIKIKPLRLLLRKRAITGNILLGFSTPLNTGTAPLGIMGGASITYTTLSEEEF